MNLSNKLEGIFSWLQLNQGIEVSNVSSELFSLPRSGGEGLLTQEDYHLSSPAPSSWLNTSDLSLSYQPGGVFFESSLYPVNFPSRSPNEVLARNLGLAYEFTPLENFDFQEVTFDFLPNNSFLVRDFYSLSTLSTPVNDASGGGATIATPPDNVAPVGIADNDFYDISTASTQSFGSILGNDYDIDSGDMVSIDLSSIMSPASPSGSFNSDGSLTIELQYGTATIFTDGTYEYTLKAEHIPGGLTYTPPGPRDYFTYQNTDGTDSSHKATVVIDIVDPKAFTPGETFFISSTDYLTTTLYSADFESATPTLTEIGSSSIRYGSVGYNPADNFLYSLNYGNAWGSLPAGYDGSKINLLRIDNTGAVTSLGPVSGIDHTYYTSGAFGPNGKYYVMTSSVAKTIYEIDLQTVTATELFSIKEPSLVSDHNYKISDISFSPTDGLLYVFASHESGANKGINIESYDISTESLISRVHVDSTPATFAASFFGPDGIFYGYEKNSSTLFSYDPNTGAYQSVDSYSPQLPGASNNPSSFATPIDGDSNVGGEIVITSSDSYDVGAEGHIELTYTIKSPLPFELSGLELNLNLEGSSITNVSVVNSDFQEVDLGSSFSVAGLDLPANGTITVTIEVDPTLLSSGDYTIDGSLNGVPDYLGGPSKDLQDISFNVLNGSDGNDSFSSLISNDIINTGGGSDTISFDATIDQGTDVILDLSSLDTLVFSNTGASDVANYDASGNVQIMADSDNNVVIDMGVGGGNGGSITLVGVDATGITSLADLDNSGVSITVTPP